MRIKCGHANGYGLRCLLPRQPSACPSWTCFLCILLVANEILCIWSWLAARARSLSFPARTHTSLSLSLNSIFNFSIQFKCALLAWQKLYICIAKAIAAGLLTNTLSLSLRLLCTASGWKELRFQLKHRYVASLILHASIAEITAQLLSLSYV